jgi:hypothetical protein
VELDLGRFFLREGVFLYYGIFEIFGWPQAGIFKDILYHFFLKGKCVVLEVQIGL